MNRLPFLAALLAGCGATPAPASCSPAPVIVSSAVPSSCPTSAPVGMLVLTGRVTVPAAVTDLVDARGGVAAGAPVRVVDVVTGGELAADTTYYDGSFTLRLPLSVGDRPVLVCVDLLTGGLVDAIVGQELLTLAAPLNLRPEARAQTRDVGADTTVWVALLAQLAGGTTWAPLAAGKIAHQVASDVAGTDPAAELLVEHTALTPGVTQATTAEALKEAITATAAGYRK